MAAINCTEREEHNGLLLEMPTIDRHFPLWFANGRAWQSLHMNCKDCGGTIPMNKLHGYVVRTNDRSADVCALGQCPGCGDYLRMDVTLNSDLSLTKEQGGYLRRFKSTSADPFDKSLRARVSRLLSMISQRLRKRLTN
jgi:hypothetical protein